MSKKLDFLSPLQPNLKKAQKSSFELFWASCSEEPPGTDLEFNFCVLKYYKLKTSLLISHILQNNIFFAYQISKGILLTYEL